MIKLIVQPKVYNMVMSFLKTFAVIGQQLILLNLHLIILILNLIKVIFMEYVEK